LIGWMSECCGQQGFKHTGAVTRRKKQTVIYQTWNSHEKIQQDPKMLIFCRAPKRGLDKPDSDTILHSFALIDSDWMFSLGFFFWRKSIS